LTSTLTPSTTLNNLKITTGNIDAYFLYRRHDPELLYDLKRAGLDVALVIGSTPHANDVVDDACAAAVARVEEIGAWLLEAPANGYIVESWAAIDDLQLRFSEMDHFVQTDVDVGVTASDVERLRGILLGPLTPHLGQEAHGHGHMHDKQAHGHADHDAEVDQAVTGACSDGGGCCT